MWWQLRCIAVCTQVVDFIQKQDTWCRFLRCPEDIFDFLFGFTLIFAQDITRLNAHVLIAVFHQFMDKCLDQIGFAASRRSIEKKSCHGIHSKQFKESFLVCIFDMFLKFLLHIFHAGNIIKRLFRHFPEPFFPDILVHCIFILRRLASGRNIFVSFIFEMIQNLFGLVQMFGSSSLPSSKFVRVLTVSQKCGDLAAPL